MLLGGVQNCWSKLQQEQRSADVLNTHFGTEGTHKSTDSAFVLIHWGTGCRTGHLPGRSSQTWFIYLLMSNDHLDLWDLNVFWGCYTLNLRIMPLYFCICFWITMSYFDAALETRHGYEFLFTNSLHVHCKSNGCQLVPIMGHIIWVEVICMSFLDLDYFHCFWEISSSLFRLGWRPAL